MLRRKTSSRHRTPEFARRASGSKIFIIPRKRSICMWASRKESVVPVKWSPTAPRASLTDAMAVTNGPSEVQLRRMPTTGEWREGRHYHRGGGNFRRLPGTPFPPPSRLLYATASVGPSTSSRRSHAQCPCLLITKTPAPSGSYRGAAGLKGDLLWMRLVETDGA